MKQVRVLFLTLFMLLTCALGLSAQDRVVSGIVMDTSNEPLVGVSVQIKGTTIGCQTDIDGKYSLKIPVKSTVLTFTYIGFDEHKVTV